MFGDPDARHVEVPELVGTFDAEEARTAAPAQRPVVLQQALLAHHPLCAFAVDLAAELAARQGGDHPAAVGRVGMGYRDDQPVERVGQRPALTAWSSLRHPVEPCAVDLQHARHDRRPSALGD